MKDLSTGLKQHRAALRKHNALFYTSRCKCSSNWIFCTSRWFIAQLCAASTASNYNQIIGFRRVHQCYVDNGEKSNEKLVLVSLDKNQFIHSAFKRKPALQSYCTGADLKTMHSLGSTRSRRVADASQGIPTENNVAHSRCSFRIRENKRLIVRGSLRISHFFFTIHV